MAARARARARASPVLAAVALTVALMLGAASAARADIRADMRHAINELRAGFGQSALRLEPRLTLTAQRMAEAIALGQDPRGVLDALAARLRASGYPHRAHGSVLQGGSPAARDIVALWRGERTARALILTESYEEIGVGKAQPVPGRDLPPDIWVVVMADPIRQAPAGWQARVIEGVNAYRARYGLAPLTRDPLLDRAAQMHSRDMLARDFVGHVAPDGSGPTDRALAAGYRFGRIAENLTAGAQSAEEAVREWIESPPHRDAMLIPDLSDVGVGYVFAPNDSGRAVYYHYWTLVMGRR